MSNNNSNQQPTYQPPPPDPQLQRLSPLLGSWKVTGNTVESLAGSAGLVTSDETFFWLEGGYFLVQTYHAVFGAEAPQIGINYWSYDSDSDIFNIIFFSNNGPYSEAGNRYRGKVTGKQLVVTGPARFTIALDADGKVKVNDDGTILLGWELRAAEGNWQHWMDNTYTRVT